MGQFSTLVQQYQGSFVTMTVLRTRHGDKPAEQLILLHKLEKYQRQDDPRKVASYLAMYLSDYPHLPEKAKWIARSFGDRLTFKVGESIGYKNADGSYHYFPIRK